MTTCIHPGIGLGPGGVLVKFPELTHWIRRYVSKIATIAPTDAHPTIGRLGVG
jgi:hypothetical protein